MTMEANQKTIPSERLGRSFRPLTRRLVSLRERCPLAKLRGFRLIQCSDDFLPAGTSAHPEGSRAWKMRTYQLSWPDLFRPSTSLQQGVDARQRRQVYAACARLAARRA